MKKHYLKLLVLLLVSISTYGQNIQFTDANFKKALVAHINPVIDTNKDGEISISEAKKVTKLNLYNKGITSLKEIHFFTNLTNLDCSSNNLSILDVSKHLALRSLNCSSNNLSILDVSKHLALSYLDCSSNNLSILDVSKHLALRSLNCSSNNLSILDVSKHLALSYLDCSSNQLSILDISKNLKLTSLYCSSNQLSILDVSKHLALRFLNCSSNPLGSLDISKNLALRFLNCSSNNLSILDVSKNLALSDLRCYSNNLSILDVSKCLALRILDCSNTPLGSLDVSKNLKLSYLDCSSNQLSILDVSKNLALSYLRCFGNNLSILDVSKHLALSHLSCSHNQLSILDVSKHLALSYLSCSNNQLKSLDVRNCKLKEIDFHNNPFLTTAYLTNQPFEKDTDNRKKVWFSNCPKLNFICVDKSQVDRFKQLCDDYKYTNCNVSSSCKQNFFKIKGIARYSGTKEKCNANDSPFPNLKINVSRSGEGGGTTIYANGKGTYYHIVDKEGIYLVTPNLQEHQNAFKAILSDNPEDNIIVFPGQTPAIRDFCIKRSEKDINDLEILIKGSRARPGFKTTYQITYKNKGNTVQSGTIKLTYDAAKQKYVSTTGNLRGAPSKGEVVFSFNNLQLFETRTFTVTFEINKPTDTPPVNGGDELCYKATIENANHTDVFPDDNEKDLCQEVRNSWDPNDKTCLEGKTILPSYVGKYLHYMIRFENKGSSEATNIVVKDEIDSTKFDVKTITPLKASHSFITKISDKNKVEFIFKDINLPFEDDKNDGYVIFKVKTLPSLKLGDVIKNKAGIYFDFNKPIITNEAITTVKKKKEEGVKFTDYFKLYPNPTTHILNIKPIRTDIKVKYIYIYTNYGELSAFFLGKVKQLNLDFLDPGHYHIKLKTNKGLLSAPFVIKR